jgi:hypothetical protein
MKFLVLLLSLTFLSSAHAQLSSVSTGDAIQAAKINSMIVEINRMYDIGDIRSSLLPEAQFQSRNGSCWVLMKGQIVAGSLYATLTGRSSLPAAEGRFLRNAGGNAAELATTQEEEFKSHTHVQNAHSHLGGFPRANGYNYASHGALNGTTTGGTTYVASEAAGSYVGRYAYTTNSTATNQVTGGIETRPANLTVNMFIKINNCN